MILNQLKSYLKYFKQFRDQISFRRQAISGIKYLFELGFGDGKICQLDSIVLRVTSKCSLKCDFCYYEEKKNKSPTQLTLSDIEKLIISAKQFKPIIVITGGEPFERKDIFEIISLIKKHGLKCNIISNGVPLNHEKIKRIIDQKVDSIIFSLHGDMDTHNKVTRSTHAYQKLIENVTLLSHSRIDYPKLGFNCVVSQKNRESMEHVISTGQNIPVDFIKFEYLHFMAPNELEAMQGYFSKDGFEKTDYSCYRYVPEKERDIVDITKSLSKQDKVIFKPNLTDKELSTWFTDNHHLNRKCPFISRSLYIDNKGDVYPCQYIFIKMGNIKETNILDIINSEKYKRFRRMIQKGLSPLCMRCCKL